MSTIGAFDVFAPGAATTIVLAGARVSGLVLIAPLYSGRAVPAMQRAALVVLLVALVLPMADAHRAPVTAATPHAILGEALIGLIIGLGAALLIGAAESAGEVLAIQIGLQGSAIVDPLQEQQSTSLGQFLMWFAMAVLLALDVHLVMLDALQTSLRLAPVGGALDVPTTLWRTVALGGSLFALGLQFAAPVIAVIMIANVALAVLSRAAPQLNVIAIAFPIQILLGLAVLVALVPLLGGALMGWETSYDGWITHALPLLRGAR